MINFLKISNTKFQENRSTGIRTDQRNQANRHNMTLIFVFRQFSIALSNWSWQDMTKKVKN